VVLETALTDALYLNWAIPAAALPALPSSLRYDTAAGERENFGFFSLVLFRQVGLHFRGASWLALSYPQANARLYVRDRAGVASVLLLRQLAPAWMVPIARAVARQPLSAAILDYPRGGPEALAGERRWSFHAGAGVVTTAKPGASGAGRPSLGDAATSAAFFRDRSRAYWHHGRGVRRIETEHPAADALPMAVELGRTDWLETFLPFAPEGGSWTEVHSAFLVPEVRLAFELGSQPEPAVAPQAVAAG
jgi:hypothetical protein